MQKYHQVARAFKALHSRHFTWFEEFNLPGKMSMSLSAVRRSLSGKEGSFQGPDDTPRPAHPVLPLAHRTEITTLSIVR